MEKWAGQTTVTALSKPLVWLGDSPLALLTVFKKEKKKKALLVGGGLALGIKAFHGEQYC